MRPAPRRWTQPCCGDNRRGGTSWIPYAIVFVVTAVLIAVTLMRINKTYLNKETK